MRGFEMWYFRIRKCIDNRISYDVWVDNMLVHYNFYENQVEVKNNSFNILYDCKIKPFMKVDKKWKRLFKAAFPQ